MAGTFYPEDPDELRGMIEALLSDVDAQPHPATAAIVPHAGLVYSGACAAQALKRIAPPAVAVIIGPNHTGRCGTRTGVSTWSAAAFETPLGPTPIAEPFVARLAATFPAAQHDPRAHAHEHAIEVVLPFLSVLWPAATLVPIVLATDRWESCRALGDALATVIREGADPVCLIASSDMTHYESAASASEKDRIALAAIERVDGEALLTACRRHRITMCGRGPAAAVLQAARQLGAMRATVVDYRHSGMVAGDDRSVVAYAGVVVS